MKTRVWKFNELYAEKEKGYKQVIKRGKVKDQVDKTICIGHGALICNLKENGRYGEVLGYVTSCNLVMSSH